MSADSPLVDVAWLAAHAGDPNVRIADVRFYLAGKRGVDEYARGHLPGAVFVDVDRDLASPRGSGPGRHPLPSAAAFAQTLSRLGALPQTVFVAYDDAGGAFAARLWWLLRHFGHRGGRVLDGGIGAWKAAGFELTTDVPAIEPAPLLDLSSAPDVIDKAGVAAVRHGASAVVLDARAADRYEGKNEPIDPRAGHVPSARSAPFAENLTSTAGTMRTRAELEAHYRALGALDAKTVVCYCGSGVTACHDALALALVGRDDVLLYEGSWSDWAADLTLPIATGPDPSIRVEQNQQEDGKTGKENF
jgi:thiosulfate/3-mercaptopyruvate sulfurtransferase